MRYSAYVLSIIQCALVDNYVAYYLLFGCRRCDTVRSFTTLKELLATSRWMMEVYSRVRE